MTDDDLVRAVRDRIYALMPDFQTAPPDELPVTLAEYEACERAVLKHLEESELPPFVFTRTGRGMLFKNVEIYIE